MLRTQISLISDATQGDSEGKVTILGVASISHCEKESSYELVSSSERLPKMEPTVAAESVFKEKTSGFGGLEVACWPLAPKFAGSNPAEAVGFFRAKKSSARLPSEGK